MLDPILLEALEVLEVTLLRDIEKTEGRIARLQAANELRKGKIETIRQFRFNGGTGRIR